MEAKEMDQGGNGNPRRLSVFALSSGKKDRDRDFWTRVGTAFVNRDGSLSVHLEANAVSGRYHIRPHDPTRRREVEAEGGQS